MVRTPLLEAQPDPTHRISNPGCDTDLPKQKLPNEPKPAGQPKNKKLRNEPKPSFAAFKPVRGSSQHTCATKLRKTRILSESPQPTSHHDAPKEPPHPGNPAGTFFALLNLRLPRFFAEKVVRTGKVQ
jgi:hypothetical protein